ncbi:ABC transporter ATP-binding protein [bacterium]|nr:ABC transporter ATP-binding protein [bacterium]
MSARNQAKRTVQIKYLASFFQKVALYWKVLVRHLTYFSSFDKKSFWKGIIAGLLKAPINAANIFLTGLFVDSIVTYYKNPTSFHFFSNISVPLPVIYLLALFCGARFVRVLDIVYQSALIRIKNESIVVYRQDITEKFHKLNSQEIDGEQVKDLITKIESFWLSSAVGFYERLAGVGEYLLSIVIALGALFAFSPVTAILVLLVPIPQIIVEFFNNRRHTRYVDNVASLMLERNYYFSALIDARTFPERKINGVFRSLITRYRHVADLVSSGYKTILVGSEKKSAVMDIIDQSMLLGLKTWVLVSNIMQRMAIGKITATLGYVDSLYKNSYNILKNLISMFDELTFIKYLYEFQDIKGFADNRKKGKHLPKGTPRISLEDASFTYTGTGKQILKDVSVVIEPGEKVMLLGKDGTGKSSILALLAGMYVLKDGLIRMSKTPVPKLARGQIKAKMSVVPEDFARYYLTLRENIVLGDPKKQFDVTLYKKALSITGLDVWMKAAGIDDQKTILGNYFDGSVSISSGHWQRLAIARAIYRNRDIFLFDQPFTYIDGHSVKEMLPKLLKFIGKRTLIWISEHTTHAKYMTKVYELEDHKLRERKFKVREKKNEKEV